jgi:prepilin-type N-terminal cleavage/methylation domain-containing protein
MATAMLRQRLRGQAGARPRGFTLTEVLVVVVLIAIVSGLGGGIYVGTYKRLQVERAARAFLLAARYARLMAIEKQQRYSLDLSFADANEGFVLTTREWNTAEEQSSQVIVRDYYSKPMVFEGGVKFESVAIVPAGSESGGEIEDEERGSIVFSPDGTAQTAVIQIGDGTTHYSVRISAATGRAKMYVGTTENVKITTTDLDAD